MAALHPRRLLKAVARSIEAHGGGARGLVRVALRTFGVVRALGLRAFAQRVKSAVRVPPEAPALPDAHEFPEPAPLDALRMRVGVVAHVFYGDLVDELAGYLARMPAPYRLLVSVPDEATRQRAQAGLSRLGKVTELVVRVVPNRGRDIAPMLVTFREEILALDVFAHVHTKKSLYTGGDQHGWRRYLLDGLLGSTDGIARHLGRFQADPQLGILYPESFPGVPAWAHTWLSNLGACRELGGRLGIPVEPGRYFDFPAGSMFWGRVEALRPLFDLGLEYEDFPEERGQTDGTLQHAVERLLVAVVRNRGFVAGIEGSYGISAEGQRNWVELFSSPVEARLALSAVGARRVTTDLFDTLVVRPFLTPDGARAYLAHCAGRRYGVAGFAELRARAEAKARANAGSDVDLDAIYRAMAGLADARNVPVDRLKELELELEARHLAPRESVAGPLSRLEAASDLVVLSDMYLDAATLRKVLPPTISGLPREFRVSCETGMRKDADLLWQTLPDELGVSPAQWLHVGDNEHSDIQLPRRHGLPAPVHVVRPSALLDVHPALRPLRPARFDSAPWADQLWLGLLANRFAAKMDTTPDRWIPTPVLEPEDVGYCVLGPLLVDYLPWVARSAAERGCGTILFLSREGHLLSQAFSRLQAVAPALSAVDGRYFLTSRRASGMASLHSAPDLGRQLRGTYNGTLDGLLRARLGEAAAAAARAALGSGETGKDVYLPEMHETVVRLLAPALPGLLELAAREREAYRAYWDECVGDRRAIVADLGYSGSIQASLARAFDVALDGAYFALDRRSADGLEGQWAAARYHDGCGPEAASTILRNDLLLEALLTAPHPQFSHFSLERGSPVPHYGEPELASAELEVLGRIHAGALQFVDAVGAVCGEDAATLAFDPVLVQRPLQCLGNGLWRAPCLSGLAVEDAFTGRGRIRPH